MIGLLILLGYVVGWLGTSAVTARSLAEHQGPCSCHDPNESRHYGKPICLQMVWHWRGNGTLGVAEVMAGTLLGVAWPLLLLPASVWWLASRKETPKGLQNRIAELERANALMERDLGIGGSR